jgi:hypothetical protein
LVGAVPSGFTLEAGFLIGVAFAGVGFTGVALVVVEEAALVVFFNGVDPTVLFTGLDSDVLVAGFFLTGSGFVVPRGVRVRAGFEASLTAALPAVTGVFFTGVEIAAGVNFAAVDVVFAGVEADAPAALSFLGTLFAGVAAELAVLVAVAVAVAAGFLTGVALVADAAGFFVVDSATLEMFPTLAEEVC